MIFILYEYISCFLYSIYHSFWKFSFFLDDANLACLFLPDKYNISCVQIDFMLVQRHDCCPVTVVWNERWLVSRLISSLRSPEFSKQTKIRGLLPASVARLCIHMWKRRIRGIQWCWSHQNRRILSDLNLRTFITFSSGILLLFFRPVSGKNLMKNVVRMIFLLEMTLPRCFEGKWIKKLSVYK